MSKYATPLLLVSLCCVVACNKDEEDTVFAEEKLVGTWNVSSAMNTASLTFFGIESDAYSDRTSSSDLVITFRDNDTYSLTGSATFDVSVADSTATDTVNFNDSGRWSVDGQQITLTNFSATAAERDTSRFEVTRFVAGERLSMTSNFTESQTDSVFMLTVTVTGTTTIELNQ